MTWRIDVRWDGERWSATDLPVVVQESTSILASTQPGYSPRSFGFRMDLGNTLAKLAAGRHPATCQVQITFGGRLLSTAPVVSMVGARAGELTQVEVSDRRPRDGTKIPSLRDMRIVSVDEEQTARNQEQALEAARIQNDRYRRERIGDLEWRNGSVVFTQKIVEAVWATAYADKVEGRVYPLILGRPGSDGTPAAPAYPIDASNELLLVAGHQCTPGAVIVYRVQTDGTRSAAGYTVSHTTDLSGRLVAVVDITSGQEVSGSPIGYDEGSNYFVAWNGTASGVDGDAAGLLRYLAGQDLGVRVDHGSITELRGTLASFSFGGVVTSPTSAWSLIQGNLLPMLPVIAVPTNQGVGFRHIQLDATGSDARVHLRAGPELVLTGPPKVAGGDTVRNLISVNYSYNLTSSGYANVVAGGAGTSDIGERSRQLHGVAEEEVDAPWVYSAAVAGQVLRNQLLRRAVDRVSLQYQCNPATHGVEGTVPLRVGDVVRLTDSDAGLTARTAMISSTRRFGQDLRVTLTLLG